MAPDCDTRWAYVYKRAGSVGKRAFPCGAWPDLRISREKLVYRLRRGEKVIADRGYRGSHWHMVPDDSHVTRNKRLERMKGIARARHETVNKRFKEYGCLKNKWRHERSKHHIVMGACANMTQLKIQKGKSTFPVKYDDRRY